MCTGPSPQRGAAAEAFSFGMLPVFRCDTSLVVPACVSDAAAMSLLRIPCHQAVYLERGVIGQ